MGSQIIQQKTEILPSEPLLNRLPIHDADGKYLSDFMMLVRGLKTMPKHIREEKIRLMYGVLAWYSKVVVFADLNMKLSVLWVTTKPVHGYCMQISTAVSIMVPEAVLVGPMVVDGNLDHHK